MASEMQHTGIASPLPQSSLLPVHIAMGKLYLSTRPLQNPALLIQPSLDLLVAVGETAEMRKVKARIDAVTGPEESQMNPLIVVPLGLGTPYGLALEQAEYTINRMSSDLGSHFVTSFFEHLCLDADIRVWIEEEMGKCLDGNANKSNYRPAMDKRALGGDTSGTRENSLL